MQGSILIPHLTEEQLATMFENAIKKVISGIPGKQGAMIPVTRKTLMERLDLGEATILKLERQGVIPVIRIGGAVRYDYDKVIESLITNKKTKKK